MIKLQMSTVPQPIVAELIKLRTLPIIRVTTMLIILTGWLLPMLLVLVAAQMGEDPARAVSQSINLLEVGAILLGAAAGGSEFAGHQIATSLLATPNRLRFVSAKLTALVIWIAPTSLIATLGGAIIIAIATHNEPNRVLLYNQLGVIFGGVSYLAALAIIACCVSLITKSQAATITILLFLFEVITPMFAQNLPILHWLPNQIGNTLFNLTNWKPGPNYSILALSLLTLTTWCATLLVISAITFNKRDTN